MLALTSVSVLALLLYEYLITLEDEINVLWRRQWSSATAIFYINRWLGLTWSVVSIMTVMPIDTLMVSPKLPYD